MAKFLTGSKLNTELEEIIENAQEQLIIISPYIKLHDRYISTLKSKIKKFDLKIVIVFGKNEGDLYKSLKASDLNFFTEFPNIEIKYEKRLHAKYYANESNALITSMNLYSFSQDNNIEAGILTKSSILNSLTDNLLSPITGGNSCDFDAFTYFERVILQAEPIFIKVPEFETSLLGYRKNYKGSKIITNNINSFFNKSTNVVDKAETNKAILNNYNNKSNQNTNGYCIRTGKTIQFNPKKPFTDDAYNNWLKFKNIDYPEKYCHYSGEPTNGETTFSKPILKKNWHKAKEAHNAYM